MKRLSVLILGLIALVSYGQDSPNYYVQFKVDKVSSEKDAAAIDKKISSKKGIIKTHTDHITSTFFCTMNGEAEYIFEDFEAWFEKLGFAIVCFNKGIQGDGRMVSPHELKNCEDSNTNP